MYLCRVKTIEEMALYSIYTYYELQRATAPRLFTPYGRAVEASKQLAPGTIILTDKHGYEVVTEKPADVCGYYWKVIEAGKVERI